MTPISSRYPDVVYPVRRGNYNDELRYSLRSLSNVPHGNVILSGYIPNWAEHVTAVEVEQDRHASHWHNVRENLIAALDIASDPFYLFNDDFYVMQPVDRIPIYHAGPLTEVVERYRRNRHTGTYWQGMKSTLFLLQEWGYSKPLGYELHLPMLLHHDPLKEALIRGQGIEALALRTAYGNIAGIGGEQREDCKILARAGVTEYQSMPYLSSNDDLPWSPLGRHLAQVFSSASRYESDS
jgi:hypothetical protein